MTKDERLQSLESRTRQLGWALSAVTLVCLASLGLHWVPHRDLSVHSIAAERVVVVGSHGEERATLQAESDGASLELAGDRDSSFRLQTTTGMAILTMGRGTIQSATMEVVEGNSRLRLKSAEPGDDPDLTLVELQASAEFGAHVEGKQYRTSKPSAAFALDAHHERSAELRLAHFQIEADRSSPQHHHNLSVVYAADRHAGLEMTSARANDTTSADLKVNESGRSCLGLSDHSPRQVLAGFDCRRAPDGKTAAEPSVAILDAKERSVFDSAWLEPPRDSGHAEEKP